jgi:hypothetical protein
MASGLKFGDSTTGEADILFVTHSEPRLRGRIRQHDTTATGGDIRRSLRSEALIVVREGVVVTVVSSLYCCTMVYIKADGTVGQEKEYSLLDRIFGFFAGTRQQRDLPRCAARRGATLVL